MYCTVSSECTGLLVHLHFHGLKYFAGTWTQTCSHHLSEIEDDSSTIDRHVGGSDLSAFSFMSQNSLPPWKRAHHCSVYRPDYRKTASSTYTSGLSQFNRSAARLTQELVKLEIPLSAPILLL